MLLWNKICGFSVIFFISAFSCTAQERIFIKDPVQSISKEPFNRPINLPAKINPREDDAFLLRPLTVIPQNYYTQHFGIMCKKELAIEKATKIPFRFRLGSLQQCNYYEGKK